MVRDPDEWLPTRRSLLSRLKNWDDQESWREFFSTYWKLIYGVAIKSGLTDTEAEDVVQDTVLTVAKKMDAFNYAPAVCSFKGWLRHVTRLRILDQLRKRQPPFQNAAVRCGDTSGTAPLERVADPSSLALDTVWDEEWAKNLVDAAMERVKRRVKPAHYQLFHLHAIKAMPAGRVASMLGVTVAQVYLVKHRLSRLVRKEIRNLEARAL
jgi:RNA polymerase sigma-70 factor (ECF subfamily)